MLSHRGNHTGLGSCTAAVLKCYDLVVHPASPLGRGTVTPCGSLKRSARAVQLFGRLAVLETHTLRY